jgi:2-enoate reductase
LRLREAVNNYPCLFQPGRIGSVEVKNRIVMAPMGTTGPLVGYGGTFSDRVITYYERRAKGETGLIITGLNLVSPRLEPWEMDGVNPNIIFDSPWRVPNFLQLTERVHDFGAKIFPQLTAGWGRVFPGTLAGQLARRGAQFVAASSGPLFWKPEISARELTTEEVDGLVRAFGNAAVIAKQGGFDGIELHGHEGYLMDQFTCALWNKRSDKYGGDLMGRMHFVLSIIRVIREAVGTDFPVIYRYGLEHRIPGGRTADEGIEMAGILEQAGVAALHVDAGCYENWFWPHPPEYQPPGCMVDMAAMVKPHLTIPVITVGRLGYPDLANRILEEGKADFIALGRPLLADPDFAAKARKGEIEEIRPCIGCHECFARLRSRLSLSCAVNPQCGDEERLTVRPASVRKKVMVIGGGIAGMEAARVCALRGHEVILYEKSDCLGGSLHSAGKADFKQDIARLLAYQVDQVGNSRTITIRLKTDVNAETVEAQKPDVLFIAAGSAPLCEVDIRGLRERRWVTAEDAYREDLPAGETACIVGGGSVGCETALYLAKQGWSVNLVETLDTVAADLFEANRMMLLELLQQYRVNVLTGAQVREATAGAVLVSTPHGEKRFEADLLVLCIGRRPVNGLVRAVQGLAKEVYVVGDCAAPRKIKDAIWEAYKLAITV